MSPVCRKRSCFLLGMILAGREEISSYSVAEVRSVSVSDVESEFEYESVEGTDVSSKSGDWYLLGGFRIRFGLGVGNGGLVDGRGCDVEEGDGEGEGCRQGLKDGGGGWWRVRESCEKGEERGGDGSETCSCTGKRVWINCPAVLTSIESWGEVEEGEEGGR